MKNTNDTVHLGITMEISLTLPLSYSFNYRSRAIPVHSSHGNHNSGESARLVVDADGASVSSLPGECSYFIYSHAAGTFYLMVFGNTVIRDQQKSF